MKGKSEPIQAYKVESARDEPKKTHRFHGLRSELVGRKAEISALKTAVRELGTGKGVLICLTGDAGTGKSRLIEELRASLDLTQVRWREGHAYSYTQNTSYSLMIDLLNRALGVADADSPTTVRWKIEKGVERVVGKGTDLVPYIGSLLSLSYPEVENMSPDSWKFQVRRSISTVLAQLIRKGPTVICLEDLHWADPSSIELLRYIISEFKDLAVFLCTYRPPFQLFPDTSCVKAKYLSREIRLRELPPSDVEAMMESLLKTKSLPVELCRLIQQRAEGNPFYVEEVTNSLVETERLVLENGEWKLKESINESFISPTIQGVVSARIDRLNIEDKHILQEASVIGRAFLFEVLKRITDVKADIDQSLGSLEGLDLIRIKSIQPELEYLFKHALTQEIVYSGLLKKQRIKVHERIGLVIEQLFQERLPEFYETLAYHFKNGQSAEKALHYLIKSGEKSLKRYALEESHKYFGDAYQLIDELDDLEERSDKIIELLTEWSPTFYCRGDSTGLLNILQKHEKLRGTIKNEEQGGMLHFWQGVALQSREYLQEAHKYLIKALAIGEATGNQKVIGYSCAWLCVTCADLGLLDDAVAFGNRAHDISMRFESDQMLFFLSTRGLGGVHYFRGECRKVENVASLCLDYGRRHSDLRFTTMGHYYNGISRMVAGDFESAIESYNKAIEIAVDPILYEQARAVRGMTYIYDHRHDEAAPDVEEVIEFSHKFGLEFLGSAALFALSCALVATGNLAEGVRSAETAFSNFEKKHSKFRVAATKLFLANAYSRVAQKDGPKKLSFLFKNMGFLVKTALSGADRKAEEWFEGAIQVSEEIGAKGLLGQALLGLGLLHRFKGRSDQASKCIRRAIDLFEHCHAQFFLKEAKDALDSLKD